jgi:hypothetical protein
MEAEQVRTWRKLRCTFGQRSRSTTRKLNRDLGGGFDTAMAFTETKLCLHRANGQIRR